MADGSPSDDRERLRHWVERWANAGQELARLRRIQIESADTRTAVRQLFPADAFPDLPPRTTSGLVDQQAWFAKLRK